MILSNIAEATKRRVALAKEKVAPKEMEAMAFKAAQKRRQGESGINLLSDFAFEKVMADSAGQGGIRFICEVKKASPSKGLIAADFPYLEIAKEYEQAGASCISVLTEPDFFQGCSHYLTEIKQQVSIPVLRKDFILDEYQIYEAEVIGADCILLICTLLNKEELRRFKELAELMGLSVLTEVHDEAQMKMAIEAGSRMIGVNNRDLNTFEVDIHNSERLRAMAPPEILFVAESGIRTRSDIRVLEEAGVNGVLIGETLMRSTDKKAELNRLKGITC